MDHGYRLAGKCGSHRRIIDDVRYVAGDIAIGLLSKLRDIDVVADRPLLEIKGKHLLSCLKVRHRYIYELIDTTGSENRRVDLVRTVAGRNDEDTTL